MENAKHLSMHEATIVHSLGSAEFFSGKHAVLFVATLLFLLSVPCTVTACLY